MRSNILFLQGAEGGSFEPIYGLMAIVGVLFLLFFIFKAGQWYGESRKNKQKE